MPSESGTMIWMVCISYARPAQNGQDFSHNTLAILPIMLVKQSNVIYHPKMNRVYIYIILYIYTLYYILYIYIYFNMIYNIQYDDTSPWGMLDPCHVKRPSCRRSQDSPWLEPTPTRPVQGDHGGTRKIAGWRVCVRENHGKSEMDESPMVIFGHKSFALWMFVGSLPQNGFFMGLPMC